MNKQAERIERILLAAGIKSRAQLQALYDKDGGYEGLKQIGPKRAHVLKVILLMGDDAWRMYFPQLPLVTGWEME